MLPILRILSVGGVFLAIAILILALIPPGGKQLISAQREVVARGALIDPGQHPEWRQFLIQAALRRADELESLRALPETVIRRKDLDTYAAEKLDRAFDEALNTAFPVTAAPVFAGLPAAVVEAEADDVTGSIGDNPGATMPIDIGEASSTELPVTTTEDAPPIIRLPALQLPPAETLPLPESRPPATGETNNKVETPRRIVQRPRRKAAAPAAATVPAPVPPPFNILAAIFESLSSSGDAGRTPVNQATATPANRRALAPRAVIQ